MLQRQEPDEQTSLTERRVTTEEFTQAVAALEARKEAERQRLAGTVPIAQTVQELGLDAQPDEIWAEVQTQRARQAAAHVPQPPQSHFTRVKTPVQVAPRRQRRFRIFPLLLILFFAMRLFSHHAQTTVVPDPSIISASIETFAEIPNGRTVFCDNNTLLELQKGKALSQVLVHESYSDNDWTLIKYDGHVYLRGYTLPLSDEALQVQPVKIYNTVTALDLRGQVATRIAIRLDKAHWLYTGSGGNEDGDWSQITVSHPHLDSHAREIWSDYTN